jgi:CheY-like chemotaxis protein
MAPASAGAARRRILVADDHQDSVEMLVALLRLKGHEVHSACDGAEALRLAEEQRPEVVLLDLGMPGVNGYDCCRRLRAAPWGKALRVFALSGWGQEEDRRRSREAGFDGHMVKPLDERALAELLREDAAGA